MAQALFVTTADINKFTALNGSIDVDKYIQFIKVAQDIHIQGFLGTDLFNKINDDIVASSLASPYTTLLSTYIKPMVIWWGMVEYMPYAAYMIANKGVYKKTSENGESIEKNEVDFLIEKARDTAQHYTERFIDYICNNSATYPEYNSNSNGDMYPDTNNNFSGWVI